MPIQGFTDINGVKVPLGAIDIVNDAHRFNCSPATLRMLLDSVKGRDGLGFTASMIGKEPRQMLLEATTYYYPTTGELMASHMGTFKHQTINVAHDRLIVEQRFESKRISGLSGQIDHAAIVEVTDDGTLVVDLYDLKTVKWYSVTLMQRDVWKNHPDYAWQLNLCAVMLEEVTDLDELADLSAGVSSLWPIEATARRIRVRNLYLECIPADSSYKQEDEARKLGMAEYQKVLIPVDRRPADEVYAVYEAAIARRDQAIADNYAPVCKETWSNKTVQHLRCRKYCSVRDNCIRFSMEHHESHPIAELSQSLAASIAMKEAS